MTGVALAVALAVLAGLTAMQVLLIAGRPYGEYAWGGQHRVLPERLRAAAVGAIVLYAAFAALLLSRAGALAGTTSAPVVTGTWILFGYLALSILLNLASRSRSERLVQTPVSGVLTVAVLVIATEPT